MKKLFITLIALSFTLISCDDEADSNQGVQLDPHGSIDVTIRTNHFSGYDLLTTTKVIHDLNGSVVKTLETVDTLPSLGMTSDVLNTGRTYEDDNGDEQEIDTTIVHNRDYQMYISVKK